MYSIISRINSKYRLKEWCVICNFPLHKWTLKKKKYKLMSHCNNWPISRAWCLMETTKHKGVVCSKCKSVQICLQTKYNLHKSQKVSCIKLLLDDKQWNKHHYKAISLKKTTELIPQLLYKRIYLFFLLHECSRSSNLWIIKE